MNSQRIITALAAVGIILSTPFAFGGNLTLSDNNTGTIKNGYHWQEGYYSSWYKGGANPGSPYYVTGIQSEYMEVEPGMVTGKQWDLVAFVNPADGVLGILSSFDLKNGYAGNTIGDIFVDLTPPPAWLADPNTPYNQYALNTFGYDFAIRLNFSTNSFTVTKLNANTVLENGEYANGTDYNAASQPWRVASGTNGLSNGNLGTVLNLASDTMTYTSALNDASASALAEFPVTAVNNYATIGLSWLSPYLDHNNPIALYHLTMTCGNDNLIGLQDSGFQRVPDNAATLSLLGLGLLALGSLAKWRSRTAR